MNTELKDNLVSIIIPSYNDSHYVLDAINSALAQTYPSIEIIVVNDGSTREQDIEFFRTYNNPKVKIISKPNEGLAAARNTAIENSSGEFFVPLDADDKIAPDFVEKTISTARQSKNIGVVFTDYQYFGNSNIKVKLPEFDLKHQLLFNDVSVCCLISRSAYQQVKKKNELGYNPNMKYGYEDWDLWISIAELGYEFKHLANTLFFYRRHGTSMISKALTKHEYLVSQLIENHLDTYQKYYKELLINLHCVSTDYAIQVTQLNKDTDNILWLFKRLVIVTLKKLRLK